MSCRGVFRKKSNISRLLRKIIDGFPLLTIFAKSYILDVWLGSEYPLQIAHFFLFYGNFQTPSPPAYLDSPLLI